ncbi:Thiol-disulfide isomerase or thioredoxin [Pedobacter terrae]|uniref:Thiol-disulfide isomerase or thioredoxin n=2 Tax=Pedobacter terrae TaxID=405671 RepID=A0A1G7QCM5_9SPHI|nr:Thiol-disulfide isomerase or thioredoxin [Pedobacter terrae]
MALLCLKFYVNGQENKPVDVTSKGIQIGQTVPDITINNIHNYKTKTAKISDFKGKLLILDFWATWCSPCVAMIPRMDSLQKKFGDKVQFLSVTYQSEKEVLPFLEKLEKRDGMKYTIPLVNAENELHKLFPHVYLPHYVWIDVKGNVSAITSHREINEIEIHNFFLKGNVAEHKRDEYLPYDLKQSFASNLNGSQLETSYSSTLTKYIKGLTPLSDVSTDEAGTKKIIVLNGSLMGLYRTSLRDKFIMAKNRVIMETVDSNLLNTRFKGAEYLNWLNKGNGFCYELKVEPALAKDIYGFMRDDLNRLFPKYKAVIETRNKEVYVLRRTSKVDKIKTKGEPYLATFNLNGCKMVNTYLIQFISELNKIYQQRSPYPIIDGTGYMEKVDIELEANLSDISSINKAIKRYDLLLEKSIAPIEVLVIKDTSVLTAK